MAPSLRPPGFGTQGCRWLHGASMHCYARAGALSDWRNWYIGVAMLLTQCGNVALMYFLPLLLRNALYGPDAAPVPPGALTAGDAHAHELVRWLPELQELPWKSRI